MAGFKPQVNLPFAGAYLAKEQGFFEQNGLDVTIEHSAGRGEHVQALVAGKMQVTRMDAATILQQRADPGLPVVSIALIGQKGRQAFAALASSGARTPKDWDGKTVGYKGTPPPDLYVLLLSAAGADINKMTLVNVGFDRVCWSKARWMSICSLSPTSRFCSAHELTIWGAADYGVPTLGLAYVTSASFLKANPDALTRFLRAALRGIAYAQENVDEAVQIALKYNGPETRADHMNFMLETELRDAQSERGFG